ncbi:MAG: hypothetical protein IJ358_02945 [Clostridia bacterium]|nr:hypothetical protein [Clostridia bacterium]
MEYLNSQKFVEDYAIKNNDIELASNMLDIQNQLIDASNKRAQLASLSIISLLLTASSGVLGVYGYDVANNLKKREQEENAKEAQRLDEEKRRQNSAYVIK